MEGCRLGKPVIIMNRRIVLIALSVVLLSSTPVYAHDDELYPGSGPALSPQALPLTPEKKGPVKAPRRLKERVPVSGQGFWKFIAVTNAVPVPESAKPFVKAAHGTLIVDADRDTVYWGLKKVGWIAFSNGLSESWVVQGDNAFTHHNMHGADLLPRPGEPPLVVAADNEGYKVYVTDTTFLHPRLLHVPEGGPFATNKTYRPTDVAIVDANDFFITDGYASGFFMEATVTPLKFKGNFFGGHEMSETPHGITYDAHDHTLLISARPEGQLKRWSIAREQMQSVDGLPAGTYLCDVDVWGDYALAVCLDGPPVMPGDKKKTPGPLMVLNLKKKTIASIIKPKEDLGYELADHMHDAVWYLHKDGRQTDVYIIFTSWQPGGIGALKLVNVKD